MTDDVPKGYTDMSAAYTAGFVAGRHEAAGALEAKDKEIWELTKKLWSQSQLHQGVYDDISKSVDAALEAKDDKIAGCNRVIKSLRERIERHHDRYWENRWRDEKAENEKLTACIEELEAALKGDRTDHYSDCAVNNAPYLPIGPCDCLDSARSDIVKLKAALDNFNFYMIYDSDKDTDTLPVLIRHLREARAARRGK